MCSMRAHQSWHDWNDEHSLIMNVTNEVENSLLPLEVLIYLSVCGRPLGPPTLYNFESKYKKMNTTLILNENDVTIILFIRLPWYI